MKTEEEIQQKKEERRKKKENSPTADSVTSVNLVNFNCKDVFESGNWFAFCSVL